MYLPFNREGCNLGHNFTKRETISSTTATMHHSQIVPYRVRRGIAIFSRSLSQSISRSGPTRTRAGLKMDQDYEIILLEQLNSLSPMH